jgi:hypothetical protein
MVKNYLFISILLFLGIILTAGCVTPDSGSSKPVTNTSTPYETPTSTPRTGQAEQIPDSVLNTTNPTPTPSVTKNEQFAEPFVSINGIKKTTYSIPDCTMGQLLPVVHEPGYGLNSVKQSQLHFMSIGEFNQVIREYTEKKDAFSSCYGIPATPYWGFVNVGGTLTARNPRPAMYNITMIVIFRGSDGPKYYTNMTLQPGQEYPFSIYIPIRVDQMQGIEGISFKFNQIE